MTSNRNKKHVLWFCFTCRKFDLPDEEEALAKPEHIPYRGIDLGECPGKMIKLYADVDVDYKKTNLLMRRGNESF